MEEYASQEANSRSASHRNTHGFKGPEGSLNCSQEPATSPHPEPDKYNEYPPTLFP
jgi:hypothetical protein